MSSVYSGLLEQSDFAEEGSIFLDLLFSIRTDCLLRSPEGRPDEDRGVRNNLDLRRDTLGPDPFRSSSSWMVFYEAKYMLLPIFRTDYRCEAKANARW
jgi:hypothetical protein